MQNTSNSRSQEREILLCYAALFFDSHLDEDHRKLPLCHCQRASHAGSRSPDFLAEPAVLVVALPHERAA